MYASARLANLLALRRRAQKAEKKTPHAGEMVQSRDRHAPPPLKKKLHYYINREYIYNTFFWSVVFRIKGVPSLNLVYNYLCKMQLPSHRRIQVSKKITFFFSKILSFIFWLAIYSQDVFVFHIPVVMPLIEFSILFSKL